MRLALVGPLPPARSGPAPYLASLLPALERRADLVLCVPDVEAVDPGLRARYDVRPLGDRHGDVDLVVYHVANNPWHAEVNAAALAGPAGLVVVHDASLHHLQLAQTLGAGDPVAYADRVAAGHGAAGRELAELAATGPQPPLGLERFLFDLLAPLLAGHRGAQVHSEHAADLVRRRCPGLPVHVVPMRAPEPVSAADLAALGVPEGRVVIGHAGFVTAPKRYDVMCAAVARLVADGLDVHLLLVGEDGTGGDLQACVDRHALADRVTCTGWQSDEDFERTVAALDVGISLRWPHVGESSASLTVLLANGVPVVAEPVGSWAELPRDVVLAAHLGADPAADLAAALRPLVADPVLRAAWGERAAAHARDELSVDRCVALLVQACRDVAAPPLLPWQEHERNAGRRDAALAALPVQRTGRLADLPPAARGQRLLAVGAPPEALPALRAWGYEVLEDDVRDVRTGSVDVVSAWDRVPLVEAHRVLVAGGLLHHRDLHVTDHGFAPVGPGLARKSGPVLAAVPLLSAGSLRAHG